VRTAKGRKLSSTRWLQRQLNDPYVAEAARLGYRSRSAFKLIQIDDRFHLLKPGKRIVDLGAAPGGWTQVAAERVGAKAGRGMVVSLDILPMEPVAGAVVLRGDFLDPKAAEAVKRALNGPADVLLCDMAASATGHRETDHLRILGLAEAAHQLAKEVLQKGGAFVVKLLQGGTENDFIALLRADFAEVKRIKPPASRPESAEFYVVATGYRGAPH
jgi:23S rRNA (uridine2552-2'-O)-methyltransferase